MSPEPPIIHKWKQYMIIVLFAATNVFVWFGLISDVYLKRYPEKILYTFPADGHIANEHIFYYLIIFVFPLLWECYKFVY